MVLGTSLRFDTYWNVLSCALRLHLAARVKALRINVNISMSTVGDYYKKNSDKNIQTLATFEVGKFIHMIEPPRADFASEVDEIAAASYNKLVPSARSTRTHYGT